jgi:hypothetical protein
MQHFGYHSCRAEKKPSCRYFCRLELWPAEATRCPVCSVVPKGHQWWPRHGAWECHLQDSDGANAGTIRVLFRIALGVSVQPCWVSEDSLRVGCHHGGGRPQKYWAYWRDDIPLSLRLVAPWKAFHPTHPCLSL